MPNFPTLTLSTFTSGSWSADTDITTLGYTAPVMRLRSRAASLFTLRIANGDPAAALPIAFETPVRIYAQLAGLAGGAKTIIFQGRCIETQGNSGGDERDRVLTLADPWYDLEHIVFQHFWRVSDGLGGFITQFSSRLFLFEDITSGPSGAWTYLDAHDQLEQIISFAQTNCGALLQAGTIDPLWTMPVQQIKALTCAQCITEVLRAMPDTVTFFDYTQTPPKLHIRQRANCTALTMPWASKNANGTSHKSSRIKSRPDIQVPEVVVQYEQVNTVDGVPAESFAVDAYPPGSDGLAIRSVVAPVDVRGGSRKDVFGEVTSITFDPTDITASAGHFWHDRKPDLFDASVSSLAIADTTINGGGGHPFGITVVDSTGATVSLTDYPNILTNGQVCSWMQAAGPTDIVAKDVTITAYFNITTKDQAGIVTNHQTVNHPMSVRLKLTNSATGTQDYTDIASETLADPAINYLAYSIWCSCNNVPVNLVMGVVTPPGSVPAITHPYNLQWEGSHIVTEQLIYQIVGPGNVLNLTGTGANTDWATMAAAIYETEIDFFHGKTTINFGPHQHLTAQQFFEILTAWRNRLTLENPAVRNAGTSSDSDQVTLGTDTQKENTNHAPLPSYENFAVVSPVASSNQVALKLQSATNGGQLYLVKVDGSNVKVVGSVDCRLALTDIPAGDVNLTPPDGLPVMACRKLCVTLADGVTTGASYMPCTYPQ